MNGDKLGKKYFCNRLGRSKNLFPAIILVFNLRNKTAGKDDKHWKQKSRQALPSMFKMDFPGI